MPLRNKTVVITGASSGIGRGAAVRFAEQGANVVLAARRKRLLNDVADQCEEHGVRALVVEADVTDFSDMKSLTNKALNEFRHIDVWVNNAGLSSIGRFDEIPVNEHEQVLQTNLLGCLYGSYLAIRQFRTQGHGTLINIASYLGKGAAPYQSSYTASKHGIRGLDMSIRQELHANEEDDHIHVCTVMPTSMDTPFFQHAANHSGHPVVPIPPVYDPKEVIDTILRLAVEPEDEVVVGRRGKVASALGKVAPEFLERRMAEQTHREFEKHGSAGPSTGSLFKPMSEGTEVRGGWQHGGRGGGMMKTAMAIGAAAPLIVAGWTLLRGNKPRHLERVA